MSHCTYATIEDINSASGSGISEEERDKLDECYAEKHTHYNLSQRIHTTVTNSYYTLSGSFCYYMVVNDICFFNIYVTCNQPKSGNSTQVAKLSVEPQQSQTITVPPTEGALEGSPLLINIGTKGYVYMSGGEAGKTYQTVLIFPASK